jgi:uncharacterized protein (DUF1015 family)
MSCVRPFRALRYDTRRVDLGRVIVPPYDVIAAEDREAFFERDPHNAIRLELTRDVEEQSSTDYAEIPRTLADWSDSGVLIRDSQPGFYPLRQRFAAPDGGQQMRQGFLGLLRLTDYENGVVRPHERTLEGPKGSCSTKTATTRWQSCSRPASTRPTCRSPATRPGRLTSWLEWRIPSRSRRFGPSWPAGRW